MSDGAIATRGEVEVCCMTLARARADGLAERLDLCAGYMYLLLVVPDDGAGTFVNCPNLASVATWILELAPHHINAAVAQGEDEVALLAALTELTAAGGSRAVH